MWDMNGKDLYDGRRATEARPLFGSAPLDGEPFIAARSIHYGVHGGVPGKSRIVQG